MTTDTDAPTLRQEEEQARAERAARVAAQNDAFRRAIVPGGPLSRVACTEAVHARGAAFVLAALETVAADETFTPETDPHGDHGFGTVCVDGAAVSWRIDLFDLAFRFGSERPDDPEVTTRVLTIMLPENY